MLITESNTEAAMTPESPEIVKLHSPEPGEVLDGRFLVLELLREGGTSRVLKATDLESGDLVALKIPKEHFAQDNEFLERFRREEDVGLRVRHPYLVAMRPVGEKSRPYLVMEYAKGETLGTRLASGPRLRVGEAVRIATMILEALGELHRQGIIHRDVTPENVMLCEDGTLRIMDYGIAGVVGSGAQHAEPDEWIWGTPAYMAPEQVRNLRGDARTDLYSLGIVLYEMLTGCIPFTGDGPVEVMNARLAEAPVAPRTLNPDLPPALEQVILRAFEKDPKDRYRDVRAMSAALEPFLREWLDRPTRRKAWLREYWAEISTSILLAILMARICWEIGFRSS